MSDAEIYRTDLPRHDLPGRPHLLVRVFRQKYTMEPQRRWRPIRFVTYRYNKLRVLDAEGHSNALLRWSEHVAPLQGPELSQPI